MARNGLEVKSLMEPNGVAIKSLKEQRQQKKVLSGLVGRSSREPSGADTRLHRELKPLEKQLKKPGKLSPVEQKLQAMQLLEVPQLQVMQSYLVQKLLATLLPLEPTQSIAGSVAAAHQLRRRKSQRQNLTNQQLLQLIKKNQ